MDLSPVFLISAAVGAYAGMATVFDAPRHMAVAAALACAVIYWLVPAAQSQFPF